MAPHAGWAPAARVRMRQRARQATHTQMMIISPSPKASHGLCVMKSILWAEKFVIFSLFCFIILNGIKLLSGTLNSHSLENKESV